MPIFKYQTRCRLNVCSGFLFKKIPVRVIPTGTFLLIIPDSSRDLN